MGEQTLIDFSLGINYNIPATNNQYVIMKNFSSHTKYSVTLPKITQKLTGYIITFLLKDSTFNMHSASLGVLTSGGDTLDGTVGGFAQLFTGNFQSNYTLTGSSYSWFQVYCDGTSWYSNNPQNIS